MVRVDSLTRIADRAEWAYRVFVALVCFQGFHELEHVVQLVQVFALSIANGKGILGSVVDVEPVHFVYNTGFLTLLVATYLLLDVPRAGRQRSGTLVFALLTLSLVAQTWHETEHIAKMVEYFRLGHQNGTGGILGIGPGAIRPTFNLVVLHFTYNTVAFTPALAAFLRLGYHRPALTGLTARWDAWTGRGSAEVAG
jgi:hypothetical protein